MIEFEYVAGRATVGKTLGAFEAKRCQYVTVKPLKILLEASGAASEGLAEGIIDLNN